MGVEICRPVGTTQHELTRLVTSESRHDLWLETRLQTKEMTQEAMQCLPHAVNLSRQVIRFNETCAQETKLCIQTRNHALYTLFLKRLQTGKK